LHSSPGQSPATVPHEVQRCSGSLRPTKFAPQAMAAAAASPDEIHETELNLDAVIGFNGEWLLDERGTRCAAPTTWFFHPTTVGAGRIPSGMIHHPDGEHVIFPLGCTVVIKNTTTNAQAFLRGHTDRVTCVALSPDGKYIASGQATSMGFRAPVIVWDFATAIKNANSPDSTGEMVHKMVLHKVLVRDVSFNCDGRFVASLGGEDDNSIVVWDLETGEAVCGAPAASHAAMSVRWLNHEPLLLVSGGHYNLRKWELNLERRRLFPTDFVLGSIRRSINCLCVDPTDRFLWCGTASGDVLEINVSSLRFARASKNRFSMGTTSIAFAHGPPGSHDFVVCGNGDGTLVKLSTEHLEIDNAVKLLGGVSSVCVSPDHKTLYAGTRDGNRYSMDVVAFEPKLHATSHPDPVHSVVFPRDSSQLFLTASKAEVRLWNAVSHKELLRVQVPNLECRVVKVAPDGSMIATGWQDGRVRAFLPESGKLAFVINDAHVGDVTALAYTHDGRMLLTGGEDGRVRVWDISGAVPTMTQSWKEHKKTVTDIVISKDNDEAVSASADGSCIVWNLKRGVRQNALFASTLFQSVRYHPDESQLLTCGSDRKLGYWDTTDCSPIRQLDAATAELLSVDIDRDGVSLVTAGADKTVRVWLYDEGVPVASGSGHSEPITSVAISPDGKRIVSVGKDGAIMIWNFPPLPDGAGELDDSMGEHKA
jgi:cilia- and flagella-associated protein 52